MFIIKTAMKYSNNGDRNVALVDEISVCGKNRGG